MPLVPETKMADVGKLISLGNVLVRKVTWFVLTTTSATFILSRDFGAECMTSIANICYRLSRTHSFPFRLTQTTRSLTLIYRDNSLFPFRLTETTRSLILRLTETTHLFPFWLPETTHTLSLLHLTSSCQPHKMYTLCNYFLPCSTFTVRLAPASKTTREISSNHRKKPTTNNFFRNI